MIKIATRFYNQSQSWNYEHICETVRPRDSGRLKFRIVIRRNAYDCQSYLRGFVLDPMHLSWNLLVDRPIKGTHCQDVSYVQPEDKANKSAFERDAHEVLRELMQIVE